MATESDIVVLGTGNILFSDDGVGVYAVQALAADRRVPADVNLIDGGTLGLDLMTDVAGHSRLLIIDAVDVGADPGTIVRLGEDDILGRLPTATCHSLGIPDLIAAMKLSGICPPEVVILGIQPGNLAVGADLSAAVEVALAKVVDEAVVVIDSWRRGA